MKKRMLGFVKILAVVALSFPALGTGVAATPAFQRVSVPGLTDIAEGMNGVAVADFNRDGNLDIVATFSPPRLDTKGTSKIRFYLGNGNFGFKAHEFTVDGKSLFDAGKTSPQVPVLADFNKDGWLDLFISHQRGRPNNKDKVGNRLLITQGSFDKFIDVSAKMGIQNSEGYNRQATFGDVNLDGWLDIAIGCDLIGNPDIAGLPNQKLYIFKPNGKNFADGKFEDIGGTSLVPDFGGDFDCKNPNQKSGAPDINLIDLDNDSDLDLVQSYHNDMLNTKEDNPCGSIRFKFGIWTWKNLVKETGKLQFVKMTDNGLAQEGFIKLSEDGKTVLDKKDAVRLPYLSFADVDNDGLQDMLAIGPSFLSSKKELALDPSRGRFWKNLGGFKFEDRTKLAGFESLSWTYYDWFKFQGFDTKPVEKKEARIYGADTVFLDYNNDGFQDVVCCDRSEFTLGKSRNVLYINKGDGTFEPKPESFSGLDSNSICAETGDFNNDGLPDLIFAVDPDNSSLPTKDRTRYLSKVYKNLGDNSNGWLRLRFSGVSDAVKTGSRIEVYDASTYASTKKNLLGSKTVMANHSYKSGCPLETLFGLGKTKSVVIKSVLPGGKTLEFVNIKPNQFLDINLETKDIVKIEKITSKPKPNIIFLLMDDLSEKLGILEYMPNLKKYLIEGGATWEEFMVSDSLCCPSRATISRGQYLHNHKVLTNGLPEGGYETFSNLDRESSTVAQWMQQGGYVTGFFGKYLNGYPFKSNPEHVPPGWSDWNSPAGGNPYSDFNYTMNENGKLVEYKNKAEDYMTDVLSRKSREFIKTSIDSELPFFAYVAPYVPHSPATPAPRHADLYKDLKAPRNPNFNEEDVLDKTSFIKEKKLLTDKQIKEIDAFYRKQVLTMLAVDEMIGEILKTLEEKKQLENTYIFFTSDNGFHMGAHRMSPGKTTAYEEDINVPMFARGPGIKAGSTVKGTLAGNVDFASTFADIAQTTLPDFVDGRSILPHLLGKAGNTPWRKVFLFEHYKFARGRAGDQPLSKYVETTLEPLDIDEVEGEQIAQYLALRTATNTYIRHSSGEVEFYDNIKDPWQLENISSKTDKSLLSKYSSMIDRLMGSGGAKFREIEEKSPDSFPASNVNPYEKFADIPYKTTDSDKNLTSLDIYTPDKSGKNPVLVWIHGGGWTNGDKSSVSVKDKDVPKVFCQKGFVFVSINYRLSPKVDFPVHAEDVGAALGWVKANIASYGGDPARISISGHSAGAHLAALVATDDRYLKANGMSTGELKCVIPVDTNCYDLTLLAQKSGGKLTDFYAQIFTQNPDTWKMASPAAYVAENPKIPPMLIFYSKGVAESDDQSENRKLYADDFSNKLVSNGFVSSVYGAPEKTHSEIAFALSDPDDHVTEAFLEFLKRHNDMAVGNPINDIIIGSESVAYIDPEFLQNGSMMVFADQNKDIWVADIDRETGKIMNGSGRQYKIDSKLSKWSFFSNGPEWGLDKSGESVFYAKDDENGKGQLWQSHPPWNNPSKRQLTKDSQNHNWLCEPSVNSKSVTTRVVVYHGNPKQAENCNVWLDESNPLKLNKFTNQLVLARFGSESSCITWTEKQNNETTQVKLLDTEDGTSRLITDDGGDKYDPWLWDAPEFGGETLLCVNIDKNCIAIYRDEKKDNKAPWQRIATIRLPAGTTYKTLKSVEPVNGGKGAFGSSYFTAQAGDDSDPDTSIWLIKFSIDGNHLVQRLDDGQITGKKAKRLDPESLVSQDKLFVYYSSNSLHLCVVLNPSDNAWTKELPYHAFQDIIYKTTDSDKNLTSLDIYTPDKTGKNPVLIWIHGGSWSEGDKKSMVTEPFDMPKVFCGEGYVVVSINYRLSPTVKFPVHPEDVASAVAWVKANIAKFGGDPARINISGHSAGAHLTALVSTDEKFLKAVGLGLSDIKSAIPSDAGTYDFIAFAGRQKEKNAPMPKNFIEVFGNDENVWKAASPTYYVEKGKKIPPMLLFYSKGNDRNANNEYYGIDTKTFAKKLSDNGYQATAYGAMEMDHGKIVQSYCDPDAHTTKAFLEFLARHNAKTGNNDQPYQRMAADIPMRDGKKLAADLYSTDTKTKKPTILIQTPYDKSKYWTQFKARIPFSVSDYNVVILDWRGRFASKQAESSKANTGQDGYDAVEWIAKQSWSNGKIGTYGGSALGDVQFKTASQNPPHLVCAVPMVKDFKVTYEGFFFGGEFRKEQTESLQSLNFYEAAKILAQPIYNQYWKSVENLTDISSKIQVPMLMIGGWFDHYPDLVLRAFRDIQTKSDAKVRDKHKLVFGPWEHGNLDARNQGILEFANAEGFGDKQAIRFMDYYLLGRKNDWESTSAVLYYQMGDENWKSAKTWEGVPRNEVTCFLNVNRTLTFDKPTSAVSSTSYDYDPKNPTPSVGGKRFNPSNPKILSGPQDQKTVESRKDVATFTSEALTSDLRINGFIKAQLFFSTNQKDTDVSVRFCDVYPDGKSVLMVEGIQRCRFRNSLEKEELMVPGTVYQIDVKLQNMAMTVKKGHKIRIAVSSASYPIFEKNPNNGGKLYSDKTVNIATNKVYFGKDRLSRLILPVVKE